MEIKDLSWNEHLQNRHNIELLPRSIRAIIVGKSGSGKTTLLLNLLLQPEWLDYDRLYIFGKSLFQPEYKIIKKSFEEKIPKEKILELFNHQDEIMKQKIPVNDLIEELAKINVKK